MHDQIRSQLDQPFEPVNKLGASHKVGSWALHSATMKVQLSLPQLIKMQLEAGAELVMVEGCLVHGRIVDVTLTREQARKVLAGGEMVVVNGKAEVR